MKHLSLKNINTSEEYDRIFEIRSKKPIDKFDMRRWKKLIKYYKHGLLLDMGCLDSQIPSVMKYPDKYIGIDFSEIAIKTMAARHPQSRYYLREVYNTHFEDLSFSYVVAGELMEHLEYPEKFLKEAFRVLEAGGIFAMSVPYNETHLGEVDKDRHLWSYDIDDILFLLQPYGKVKITILGSSFFPYKYHFPNIIAYCTKI